jgi:predicted MPP superfamily phosphohydrolase
MERINVLYLSDAHITKHHAIDQRIVLDALVKDLKQICDSDLAPQYVVFSGDLVNDPDEPDAYDHFIEELLFPLSETISVNLDNFIFSSGNHDVSRRVCNASPMERDAIITHLGDHAYVNNLYLDNSIPRLIPEKVSAYTSFVKSLSAIQGRRTNPFFNVWDYPSTKLSFVALNTSALSVASLGGDEQGRLIFPDLALNAAFGEVPTNHFTISLAHHPISWFKDESAAELRTTINHKSRIHLYGHLHEPEPATLNSGLGSTTFVQAPSVFSSRKYLNGYCLVSLSPDRSRVAVTFRTYFDKQRAFGVGENVAPHGLFFPNPESRFYWTNQPLRINLKKYTRWLTEVALVEKLDFFNETTTDKRLSEVFVCPPLRRIEL